jgi:hypothetical protein
MSSAMASAVGRLSARLSLALLLGLAGWSWPAGRAAAPGACALGAADARPAAVQRIATCDECRTSGRRAGYRQCCEQVGGDYRCQWVPC